VCAAIGAQVSLCLAAAPAAPPPSTAALKLINVLVARAADPRQSHQCRTVCALAVASAARDGACAEALVRGGAATRLLEGVFFLPQGKEGGRRPLVTESCAAVDRVRRAGNRSVTLAAASPLCPFLLKPSLPRCDAPALKPSAPSSASPTSSRRLRRRRGVRCASSDWPLRPTVASTRLLTPASATPSRGWGRRLGSNRINYRFVSPTLSVNRVGRPRPLIGNGSVPQKFQNFYMPTGGPYTCTHLGIWVQYTRTV
jgi:hypothetical protein